MVILNSFVPANTRPFSKRHATGAALWSAYGHTVCTKALVHFYLTARHFPLTEAIRAYVDQRIVHAIQSHAVAHDLNRIEVQLSKGQRGARFSCHVLIQMPGHHEVNVTEHNHDLYAAIDLAEKRVIKSLVALRERRVTLARHPRKFSWEKIARRLRSSWGRKGT